MVMDSEVLSDRFLLFLPRCESGSGGASPESETAGDLPFAAEVRAKKTVAERSSTPWNDGLFEAKERKKLYLVADQSGDRLTCQSFQPAGPNMAAFRALTAYKILFATLGCFMVATLIYTLATDGSPLRLELLTPQDVL